jgi:methyltransferase
MISIDAVAFLGLVTLQRLGELVLARRNARRLIAAGGIEYGREHYPLMIGFHVVWLAGLWALGYDHYVRPLYFGLYVLLQFARYWVIATLGSRWTVRVIVAPGERPIERGPYRLLRHPNYAVVVGEIAVVPLALGMPIYAFVFSIWNAAVLAVRIRAENAALATVQQAGRG